MHYTEQLHIAAGGRGTRLRSLMDSLGYEPNYPKHLLPTGGPNGDTLLGRIVRQALDVTDEPVVYGSDSNIPIISTHTDIAPEARGVAAPPDASFFGPFLRALLDQKTVVLGASGDHYIDTSPWLSLLETHDSGPFPVTLAAAQAAPLDKGLVYDVRDTGQIVGFRRVDRTNDEDLVNIGVYVISPAQSVLQSLAKIGICKANLDRPMAQPAETIAGQLVLDRLIGIHELPAGSAFNINNPEIYSGLLNHTQPQNSFAGHNRRATTDI